MKCQIWKLPCLNSFKKGKREPIGLWSVPRRAQAPWWKYLSLCWATFHTHQDYISSTLFNAHCPGVALLRNGHGELLRSQNNKISSRASATHSLCSLAVFMLTVLLGSESVLVHVYFSVHRRRKGQTCCQWRWNMVFHALFEKPAFPLFIFPSFLF